MNLITVRVRIMDYAYEYKIYFYEKFLIHKSDLKITLHSSQHVTT